MTYCKQQMIIKFKYGGFRSLQKRPARQDYG